MVPVVCYFVVVVIVVVHILLFTWKSKERCMGKSARVGWTFVSVALHTLNQTFMPRSVIVVGLDLLGGCSMLVRERQV